MSKLDDLRAMREAACRGTVKSNTDASDVEEGGREGSNVFCITIHPHGRIVLKCVHCGFKETGRYSDRKARDFRQDSLSARVHEEAQSEAQE